MRSARPCARLPIRGLQAFSQGLLAAATPPRPAGQTAGLKAAPEVGAPHPVRADKSRGTGDAAPAEAVCRWYPPTPGGAVAQCGTAAQPSPLWSSVYLYKQKKTHSQTFQDFPALGKIPTYQGVQSRQQTVGEMSMPWPPTHQSRAAASGPRHPRPEASRGIQVALGKWRKAEERQAGTKAACCHEVRRLPWGTALLQPSPPCSTSGVGGVRAHRNIICQQ